MSDERPEHREPAGRGEHEIAAPVVQRKRGLSLVWIVPLLAAAIGAWLWWDALQQQGPAIQIEFSTADGLEAGKTKIRFKSVEVGEVESVALKPDLSGVVVNARMGPETEPLLRESSRFWVVRPRVGLGGVSGLGTLLSGAYLELDPGLTGETSAAFIGLEEPPQTPGDAPGLKLTLHADTLGSVGVGSPVLHHGIPVGKVDAFRLMPQGEGLEIEIYVEPDFTQHVAAGTRFWNASGIDISFGAEGVKFTAASFVSLLSGGIEFGNPAGVDPGTPARSGDIYPLYADEGASRDVFTDTREFVAYFSGSVRGLSTGAPVEIKGIRLGTVRDIEVVYKSVTESQVRIVLDMEPQRIGARFADPSMTPKQWLERHIQNGLRVRLASANLLTGALLVEIVVDPGQPARLHGTADELEVPTLPSTADVLSATAGELPGLFADVGHVVAGLDELVNSADAQGAMGDLRGASAAAQRALDRVTQLLASLEEQLAAQSSLQVRVAEALEELAGGMRSIRHLADMLERQPEALLRGKSGSSGD
jgi:paraquat-inducible protein B